MPTFTRNGQPMAFETFTTGEGDNLVVHPAENLLIWTDDYLAEIADIVRTPDPEPEPVRRLIPKSVVQERLNDVDKLDDVLGLLLSPGHAIFYARWFAPDWPNVYFDDEGLLTILGAVGCSEEEVAAITAPVA